MASMKVIACPADRGGCGQYRILQPAAVLNATEPVEVQLTEELPIKQGPHGRVIGVGALDCDVLVIQRPLHWWIPQAIPYYQQAGIKVVVEVDDDFHSLHPANGAYLQVHPKTSPQMNWHHLMTSCALADLVTVSTPALAERYGKHGRVRVLKNYVAESLLDIEVPREETQTVGWAGVVGSHPDDLQVTHGGVARAAEEAGAQFLCVGNGELVQRNLNLTEEPEVTGWVNLDAYHKHVARLDVGIVPLADTRFNAAKSWLKGLEYAACGVPFVASAVAEYVALENLGIGTTVRSRMRDWRRAVGVLLTDHEQHAWIVEAARERVADNFTIEDNAWRWADAWEMALDGAFA